MEDDASASEGSDIEVDVQPENDLVVGGERVPDPLEQAQARVAFEAMFGEEEDDEEEFVPFGEQGWVFEPRQFVNAREVTDPQMGQHGCRLNFLPQATALMYFMAVWTAELWDIILDETNRCVSCSRCIIFSNSGRDSKK